ncbi:hypothetical protein SO802_027894 [Lithocarpus litseifolius]|uniref:UME domain-containing protein n=1 Tax=Lithocarpus litseifolius TaxID=425828 RepID=A0AAW2BS00_9ROSI
MVKEFADAVFDVETEETVRKMIPIVLPKLVVSQQDNDQAIETLYELAKYLNTDMAPLIVNWLPNVLAFALHQADGQELLSALSFYLAHTGSDKQEIFAAALPALLDELVCFLDGGDSDEIRKSIDRKMLHAEDTLLQQQALKRIEMLIKTMGSHLSTYVPKLMVLLMHAIDKEPLQSEGLSILHFFIEQLAKVSPSSTKHEHIREFPSLLRIPAQVNEAIQEAHGSMTLKDQLRDVVDGLNHENLNVRYMVVCELSKLLNLRREEVTALITAEARSDMDVLSSLITSLLRGCAEESRTAVGQWLKLVCADCLGALGAVDPAKVKGFTCQRFKIECSGDDLIFELIHKHLARSFRAAPDTIIQYSAAWAIQELLKIAGCEASLDASAAASMSQKLKDKRSLDNRRGQKLWDQFSNYVKEIIAPCLTSRFQLPNMADSACTRPFLMCGNK